MIASLPTHSYTHFVENQQQWQKVDNIDERNSNHRREERERRHQDEQHRWRRHSQNSKKEDCNQKRPICVDDMQAPPAARVPRETSLEEETRVVLCSNLMLLHQGSQHRKQQHIPDNSNPPQTPSLGIRVLHDLKKESPCVDHSPLRNDRLIVEASSSSISGAGLVSTTDNNRSTNDMSPLDMELHSAIWSSNSEEGSLSTASSATHVSTLNDVYALEEESKFVDRAVTNKTKNNETTKYPEFYLGLASATDKNDYTCENFAITIELDRKCGVYYAGEEVRGVLNVDYSRIHSFHLIDILFMGEGTVCDVNKDETFQKHAIVQARRLTMLGDLHRTPSLWRAGGQANFANIYESGILRIPFCTSEDFEKPITLQVWMDHGKRCPDHLLGEITFDAFALAASNGIKLFSLTKTGKPKKEGKDRGHVVLSAKLMPESIERPEPGILLLTIHEASGLRSLNADLYAEAHFCEAFADNKSRCYIDHSERCCKVLSPKPAKTTDRFPFCFRIDPEAPGSAIPCFHSERRDLEGYFSFFKYSLTASVIRYMKGRPNHRTVLDPNIPSATKILAVIPTRPAPCLDLLAPICMESVKKWAMFSRRSATSVSVTMKLDRAAFAPGEKVDLSGSEVCNGSRKDLPVCLILRVYFRTDQGKRPWADDHILFRGSCPACSIMRLDSADARIPVTVYPSFFNDIVRPNGKIFNLKWSYTLELRVGAAKECIGKSVYARVPILICAAAPDPNLIQQAQSLCSPAIEDQWQLAQYIDGGAESLTSPPTFTDEDLALQARTGGLGLFGAKLFSQGTGAIRALDLAALLTENPDARRKYIQNSRPDVIDGLEQHRAKWEKHQENLENRELAGNILGIALGVALNCS